MSETMRMWTEITFNVVYLLVIWGLVAAMMRRQPKVSPDLQPVTQLFIWAFGLLALGDTGHVGFRVWAYAQGDLNATFNLLGSKIGWVGLGALSTAITVTFFYVLMLMIWQRRYQQPYGWLGIILFVAAGLRLVIMIFPQNQWNSSVPPQPWSFYRNLPLMIQGFGVAYLILRDALKNGDRPLVWIGVSVLVSFGFYLPVILFVQQAPMVGMLMIPKTLAYVAIAWIAYTRLFQTNTTAKLSATPAD